MKENVKELINQANASFAQFLATGKQSAELRIETANIGRAVGEYLKTLKSHEPHWQQLTLLNGEAVDADEPRLMFGPEHGKLFITLADKLPQPATTLEQADLAFSVVEMLSGNRAFKQGHGRQSLHDKDPLTLFVRHIMEAQAVYTRDLREEVAGWSEEKKQSQRDQLEPTKRAVDAMWEALAA